MKHKGAVPPRRRACSGHWARENPLPDPALWSSIEDPSKRPRKALADLYGFYARNEPMLTNIFRDQAVVEHLRPAMRLFVGYLDEAVRAVAARSRPSALLRGAIGHALSYSTWQSLTREKRLPTGKAVSLMASMIELALR